MAELEFREQLTYSKHTSMSLQHAMKHPMTANVAMQFAVFVPKPRLLAMGEPPTAFAVTDTKFSLEFPHFATQWLRDSTGGIISWRFQGGPLVLKSLVTIYVDERGKNSRIALEMIMRHEFLHVADEVKVLRDDLPKVLRSDPLVRQYLIDKKPVDDPMFQNWFKTVKFQQYVEAEYTKADNARNKLRDSGMEYSNYGREVSKYL